MKRMHTLIIAAIISVVTLIACGTPRSAEQSAAAVAGSWQTNPLVIDGSDNDWAGTTLLYDQKTDISYLVTNDRAYLYVLIRTANEHTQQQILRGGLTVLLNTHGVKDEHGAAGISYPTGNLHQKNNLQSARPELNTNKNITLANAKDYSIFGFMNFLESPK